MNRSRRASIALDFTIAIAVMPPFVPRFPFLNPVLNRGLQRAILMLVSVQTGKLSSFIVHFNAPDFKVEFVYCYAHDS